MVEDLVSLKENMTILEFWKPSRQLNINMNNFKNPNYPFGRCLNFGPSVRALSKTVDDVAFFVKSRNTSDAETLQVLFKDPVNGNDLKPIPLEMEGDSIKMETKPNSHFKKWRTTISLFEHVKGDPKFDCENYSEENTFSKCLEQELVAPSLPQA